MVGLNSDESIRSLNKVEERPIISQQYRAEMMAALQCVDYVTIFDEPTTQKLIEKLNPEVLVKGQDWTEKGVVGREHVESNGGRVVLLPLVEGVSTTTIVERIRSGAKR